MVGVRRALNYLGGYQGDLGQRALSAQQDMCRSLRVECRTSGFGPALQRDGNHVLIRDAHHVDRVAIGVGANGVGAIC